MKFDAIPAWMLSGQPYVFFRTRDYWSAPEFVATMQEAADESGLELRYTPTVDPIGYVMQTIVPGTEVPLLVDPKIRVTKTTCPWVFCLEAGCSNRITDMPICEEHRG